MTVSLEHHQLGAALQGSQLRRQLRLLRKQAGLTQEEVAQAMEWSNSKMIRIEGGDVRISINDLKALIALYEVADSGLVEALTQMARATRLRPWWNAYQHVINKSYMEYIGYEDAALRIQTFEPILVPGLLQTQEYAETVFERLPVRGSTVNIRDLVDVRMKRQEILDKTPPVDFVCLIDESVVHRYGSEKQPMVRQLKAFIEASRKQSVTLRVVPYAAGMHAGFVGSFTIFELPGDHGDVLFLESRGGLAARDYITEGEDPLAGEFKQVFLNLLEKALDPEETIQLIQTSIEQIEG
jgi:transcriptional regulator with XRE-family HTH domain